MGASRQPASDESIWLGEALDVLKRAQVVVLPFEHLFGLAADALNPQAVARVAAIKARPTDRTGPRPISVIIPSLEYLGRIAPRLPPLGQRLAERHWPGPLTLVIPAAPGLPKPLVSDRGLIGVRLPGPCPAATLASRSGLILTATSANRAGEANHLCHEGLAHLREAALVVAGEVQGGPGSTVVDVSGEHPVVLRQGAVSIEEVSP